VPAYGRIEQESYALVSAFVRYRLAPQFSVQANLNNLLDNEYFSQINGYGAYGDGRNGSITFTWSF
jgi:outer membrane receptor for ferric coprogen and ferric-rhodotorulic acid